MLTELLYWDGSVQHSVLVDGIAQVRSAIARVIGEEQGLARGFSLSEPGAEDSPVSLAIAVGSIGWALIHTDDALDQHRIVADSDSDSDLSIDVLFDEVTPIPCSWFIAPAFAHIAITQWLTDRTLSPEIEWADDAT